MVDSWICCTRLVEKFIKEIHFYLFNPFLGLMSYMNLWHDDILNACYSLVENQVENLYLILVNFKIVCMEMEDNNFLNSAGL